MFLSFFSLAQTHESKLAVTGGLTFRTTAMNFLNFKEIVPADPTIPYHYEKNVQGIGLNLGVKYRLFEKVYIEYYPSLRYDVVYIEFNPEDRRFTGVTHNGDSAFVNSRSIPVKDFLVDQNLNLVFGKKLSYGLGISVVNANKTFSFTNPTPRQHNIQFTTYNLFIVFDVLRNTGFEIKGQYVPSGFPENPEEDYLMFSFRLFYELSIL